MAKHFTSKDSQSSSGARKSAAAHVQTKMKVGQKNDRFENEADNAASKVVATPAQKQSDTAQPVVGGVSKLDGNFGKKQAKEEEGKVAQKKEEKKGEPVQKMEDEAAQAKEEEGKVAQKKEEKKGEPVQKMEDEAAQAKEEEGNVAQKKEEKKGEAVQKMDDEAAQAKEEEGNVAQKQEEKKGEAVQKMDDEPAQAKEDKKEAPIQKAEDEAAQTKIQREPQEAQDAAMSEMMRDDAETMQKKEEPEAQTKVEPRANVRDKRKYPVINSVEPKLLSSRGKGEPLSDEVRMEMEAKFGVSFKKVRIHTDGYAVDMAREMNAQAFTSGSDIYFNDGKFDTESMFGRFLLAHELTHVIQQGEAEKKVSADKIAEGNAARNEPLPNPMDKEAKKTQEQVEKEKKTAAEVVPEKPEKEKAKEKKGKKPKAKKKVKKKATGKGKKEDGKPVSVVGAFMKKMSEARVAKNLKKLNKLAENEQKKDDAKTKLGQTEKAVVPPGQETQSRANATQVDTVDKTEAPKPDEQKAKAEFNEAMEQAVPSSLESMDKFKEEGKGRVVGEQVRGVVTTDTQEVQQTYQEIENTPEPAPAPVPDELPQTEVAPPTPPLNMGEDVIGEVQPEHTDLSEFENKTDNVMEEEGLSEEQLDMVDSGPLAEAKEDRKQLKEKVQTGPKEVKQLEKDKKKEVAKDLKKEEVAGKKKMKDKRKKELQNTKDKQKNTKKTIEQKRLDVTNNINNIYKKANDTVKKKLDELEKDSLKAFDDGQKAATKTFEDNVKRRLDAFKSDRYSGMFGWGRWLKDKWLGMDDLPQVKRIFDSEKSNFVSAVDRLVAKITADNKKVIQECKDLVQQARETIAEYVATLGPELKSVGEQAQTAMQEKLDALDETVNKKEEELKEKLAEKREAAIKAIEEKIESMKEEMSGLAGKLAALLLGALIKFFTWAIEKIGGSSEKIMGVVNKSKKVMKTIAKSPGKFIGNLGKAVQQGFGLFETNFNKHLMGGIVEWLTGAMGGTGIKIPEKFDLKGVMSLGLQVMGLTWEQIREQIAKRVGEPVLAAAEKGLDIIVQIKEKGFIVLWDMLMEKAQEFKDKVMESISGWAVLQMVKAATIKLITMLNPAGAILQIALTIYDGVMWFIENMQRIMEFIMSIFNSIAEIAMGQLGKAAGFIEKALAKIIPIILSFLARWLKLSGIGKAIKAAVKKVRAPIQKVLGKIINFIVKKVKGFVKKGKKKIKGGKDVRNEKEKKKDLNKAVEAVNKSVKKHDNNIDKVKKDLPKIKKKYKLKTAKLDDVKGPKFKVKLKINPDEDLTFDEKEAHSNLLEIKKKAAGGGLDYHEVRKEITKAGKTEAGKKLKVNINLKELINQKEQDWEIAIIDSEKKEKVSPVKVKRKIKTARAPEETTSKLITRLESSLTTKDEKDKLALVKKDFEKLKKYTGSDQNPDILNKVGELNTKIQSNLIDLIGSELDLPKPVYTIPGNEIPTEVKVEFLSANRVAGQKPSGSPPGWEHLKHKLLTKKGGSWVRMHLINQKFGGPGTNSNLIPGPTKYNDQTEHQFDTKIKKEVGANPMTKKVAKDKAKDKVMWIKVKATHNTGDVFPETNTPPTIEGVEAPTPKLFAKTIDFKAGYYTGDAKNNKWTEDTAIKFQDTLNLDLPLWSAGEKLSLRFATREELIDVAKKTRGVSEAGITKFVMRQLKDLTFTTQGEFISQFDALINSQEPDLIPYKNDLSNFKNNINKLLNKEKIQL